MSSHADPEEVEATPPVHGAGRGQRQLSCPSWTEKPRPSPVCLCVQEELEAFEKRQQRGGRRSKRRGRREEVDHPGSASGSWRRCAAFVLLPLGGVLLSAAAYYLMSGQ